jgi:hypothetical protein
MLKFNLNLIDCAEVLGIVILFSSAPSDIHPPATAAVEYAFIELVSKLTPARCYCAANISSLGKG